MIQLRIIGMIKVKWKRRKDDYSETCYKKMWDSVYMLATAQYIYFGTITLN